MTQSLKYLLSGFIKKNFANFGFKVTFQSTKYFNIDC